MAHELLRSIAFGIQVIGPLALATLGFALIYRVSGHLHFAFGGLWVLAAFVFGSVMEGGRGPILGYIMATIVTLPLAFVSYLVYRRLSGQYTVVLTSFGIFTVLIAGVQLWWGPQRLGFSRNNPLSSVWTYTVAGMNVPVPQASIVALLSAIVLAVSGSIVLGSTAVGLRLQALSQNPELATASGISEFRMNGLSYVCGTLIANVAAGLHVLGYGASLDSGTGMMLGALTVAIIAGSVIIATVAGAMVFGLLQVLANLMAGPELISLIGYSILLLILRVKPNGLLQRDWILDVRRVRASNKLKETS